MLNISALCPTLPSHHGNKPHNGSHSECQVQYLRGRQQNVTVAAPRGLMIGYVSCRWEAAHDVSLTYRANYVTDCILGLLCSLFH